MAQANVSNGVLSIIASFSNGLDVLKKLRRGHKKPTKRSKARQQNDEDALRLSQSLRRGADEIGREYQARSMRCDGERFAVGDATAQNSLAEILIKFNTGLVGIITSFIGRDTRDRLDVDYRSLTELSNHSREQSISVLRQLYQRLTMPSPQRLPDPAPRGKKPRSKKSSTSHATPKHTNKIRHPTLARVVIENSSIPSQIALVRPSESRKPRSQAQLRETATRQQPDLSLSTSSLQTTSLPPPPYFPSDPLPHTQQRHGSQERVMNSSTKPPRHHPSSTSLSKHAKQSQLIKHKPPTALPLPTSTNLIQQQHQPALTTPTPQPHHSQPQTQPTVLEPVSRNPRPTTLYSLTSVRTGSTKLGEIPMHKWPEPWNFEAAEEANRRALESGWPLVGPAGVVEKRKGGGGVWRRWFGRAVARA